MNEGVNVFLLIVTVVASSIAFGLWRMRVRWKREQFVRDFRFPKRLTEELLRERPDIPRHYLPLVESALRDFFLCYIASRFMGVSMPSRAADALWHVFILDTRAYDAFCKEAFGRFLHHRPAVSLMRNAAEPNAGLRRAWWYCCKLSSIDPRAPVRLPLLFALDAKLGLADGFRYTLEQMRAADASDDAAVAMISVSVFSDTDYDGTTDGFGDGDGGGGDGGGDGGGGCGGD